MALIAPQMTYRVDRRYRLVLQHVPGEWCLVTLERRRGDRWREVVGERIEITPTRRLATTRILLFVRVMVLHAQALGVPNLPNPGAPVDELIEALAAIEPEEICGGT